MFKPNSKSFHILSCSSVTKSLALPAATLYFYLKTPQFKASEIHYKITFPFQHPGTAAAAAATSILLTIALAHLVRPLRAAAAADPTPDITPRREERKISNGHPETGSAATREDSEPAGKQESPEGTPAGTVHNVTDVAAAGRRGKREPQRKRKRIKVYPLLCG